MDSTRYSNVRDAGKRRMTPKEKPDFFDWLKLKAHRSFCDAYFFGALALCLSLGVGAAWLVNHLLHWLLDFAVPFFFGGG